MSVDLEKKPKGWSIEKKLVMAIGAITLVSGIGALIGGTDDKPKATPKVVEAAKPVEPKVMKTRQQGVPVDAAIDAIFRQLRVSKVCYEPERSTFFVRFVGDKELGTWADTWQMLDQQNFQHIPSNGTYFLEEIPNGDYTRVWPDVSKLYCKVDEAAK